MASNCGGRLLWAGDDCQQSLREREDFFIWLKALNQEEGWYHSSYIKAIETKY